MIGVATSVWGGYSQYLPEWLDSVAAQTRPPEQVVIVDCGADDQTYLDRLPEALPVAVVHSTYQGMGRARNLAISHLATPWAMHLDADDVLLPHALADAAELTDMADVVCLGASVSARPVLFPHVSAERILRGAVCSYSCSPYRRSLWESAPYITVNDWVDSALWVGFARQGARFIPTARPGFVYRQHPGSHSHTMTQFEKRAARCQLNRLAKGMPA